jgi:hypothetical protein
VRPLLVAIALFFAMVFATRAEAQQQHFEPTDLELEEPGTLDLDFQYGIVKGSDGPRLVTPDFELDLGITKNFELDVDAAYGIVRPTVFSNAKTTTFVDNIWISTKLGLWSTRNLKARSSWGIGLQAGPKIPLAPGAHGIGYEALLLVARNIQRSQIVLNAGGLIDPGPHITGKRPIGAELGLDYVQGIDKDSKYQFISDIGTVLYFTGDPAQLVFTAGFQYEPFDELDLNVVGLLGAPPASDQYGVLFGVSPKFHLW